MMKESWRAETGSSLLGEIWHCSLEWSCICSRSSSHRNGLIFEGLIPFILLYISTEGFPQSWSTSKVILSLRAAGRSPVFGLVSYGVFFSQGVLDFGLSWFLEGKFVSPSCSSPPKGFLFGGLHQMISSTLGLCVVRFSRLVSCWFSSHFGSCSCWIGLNFGRWPVDSKFAGLVPSTLLLRFSSSAVANVTCWV